MENFEHYLPTKFYFGKIEKNVGHVKAAGGTKVMIVSYGRIRQKSLCLKLSENL
ncbi:MAG: hypothetical protein ACLVJO_01500 [[Clostridium] scindens]